MKPKYEQLKKDILFEQNQIDIVMSKIKEIKNDITDVNITALATYLMNFYNGIENIMKRYAKEYYKKMPKGDDWHRQLLQDSCKGNKKKFNLFTKEMVDKLYNYLSFRHFFIHGYSFKLNWDKMRLLINDVDELWQRIKTELTEFMKKV